MYVFDNNVVFVETECSTKEAYEKISINGYESEAILILDIKNELYGFWGRMKTELWNWLEKKESSTSIEYNSYMKTISGLTNEVESLRKENEKLNEEVQEKDKIIDNMRQQNILLQSKVNNE